MMKLEEAIEKYSFNHVWTIDGRIMLKMEIISQVYVRVDLSIMGKEIVLSFILCVLLFVLRVVFFWGNFATCFLQSMINRNTPLIRIFLFQILLYYVVTQTYFFLLQQHTTYLFYRFTQRVIFYYLDNCHINNINP